MSGQQGAELLASARQAIKQGDNESARRLLVAAAQKQPGNYRVWLWLAGLSASPGEALDYLDRAEALKPGDATVARARDWAKQRMPKPAPLAPQPRQVQSHKSESTPTRRDPESQRPHKRHRLLWLSLILLAIISLGTAAVWLAGPTLIASLPDLQAERVVATAALPVSESAEPPAITPVPTNGTTVSQPEAIAEAIQPTPEATSNLPPKAIVAAAAEPRPTWTVTPIPTDTPTPTPTYAPTFVASGDTAGLIFQPPGLAPNERWIDVSLSTQTLVAYEGTLPVFETLVSTGKAQYPTVTGQFRIWLRLESQDMDGYRLGFDYYLKGVPYVQYFYQDYALHGTYWHSNFGHPMSHGCVNLSPADAAWLFAFADYGTLVNVHP